MSKMSKSRTFKHGGNKRFANSLNGKDETKAKLGHIPEEMLAYYRQVSATLEAGFDDDDPGAKREFLNNVYQAVKDEGIQVSQNQTVSRILEALFTHSEASHLNIVFCRFCKDLGTVCFDRFASHVFQSLTHYLPAMYDDADTSPGDKATLKDSLLQLCLFVAAHMEKFLNDTYGSHVLRSLLEVLGGVFVREDVIRSHISRNQRKDTDMMPKHPESKQLSVDFKTHFDKIKDKVLSNCDYEYRVMDTNYCPVLQTVLLILHKARMSEYTRLAETIMEKTCPYTEVVDKENVEKNLPIVVQDSVGSFLIELLVSLTPDADIPKLFNKLFKGKLIYFAVHPVANFILQKLLSCLTHTETLREIVVEISPFMEDILAVNHIGVITKLAEACKRNQEQQEEFMQAVMNAFHCNDPKERHAKIAPLIAAMQTYDMFHGDAQSREKDEVKSEKLTPSLLRQINLHGSLLLQQMLHFDRPSRVVTSLLSLSPAELSSMASDQCGSHIVEAFFSSSTVWEKNKEEFLRKMKGFYTPIACSKNGSRCLEGIWKSCSTKMKAIIAEELMKSRERIESDKFGHFLYKNFALFKFSTRKKEWMEIQSGMKKKQQMLQEILEGNTGRKKKTRKRKAGDDGVNKNEESPVDGVLESRLHEVDGGADVNTEGNKLNAKSGHSQRKKRKQESVGESSDKGENNVKSVNAKSAIKKKLKNKKRKNKNKKKKAKV